MAVLGLPSLGTVARALTGRHGTGFRPDPKEVVSGRVRGGYRDFDELQLVSAPANETVSVEQWCGPVLDQGPTNSCVLHAWLDAELTTLRALHGVADAELGSILAGYYWGRKTDGIHKADLGSIPMSVLSAIGEYGIPPASAWPFKIANINKAPPKSVEWDARGRRGLRGTHRIYDRGDNLLQACRASLASRRAFILDLPVDDAFSFGSRLRYTWDQRGKTRGYHMVEGVAIEYQANTGKWWIKLKNSWGAWGPLSGYAYVDLEFLLNATAPIIIDPREPAR